MSRRPEAAAVTWRGAGLSLLRRGPHTHYLACGKGPPTRNYALGTPNPGRSPAGLRTTNVLMLGHDLHAQDVWIGDPGPQKRYIAFGNPSCLRRNEKGSEIAAGRTAGSGFSRMRSRRPRPTTATPTSCTASTPLSTCPRNSDGGCGKNAVRAGDAGRVYSVPARTYEETPSGVTTNWPDRIRCGTGRSGGR